MQSRRGSFDYDRIEQAKPDPVSLYNSIVDHYNNPMNCQHGQMLRKAYSDSAYRNWYRALRHWYVLLVLVYLAPYFTFVTLVFTLYAIIIHENALAVCRKNQRKVPDMFENMILDERICDKAKSHYTYFSVTTEDLETFPLSEGLKEILRKKENPLTQKVSFMVYDRVLLSWSIGLMKPRWILWIHLVLNLILFVVMQHFVYAPYLCFNLFHPIDSISNCENLIEQSGHSIHPNLLKLSQPIRFSTSSKEEAVSGTSSTTNKLFIRRGIFHPKHAARPRALAASKMQQIQKTQAKRTTRDSSIHIRPHWEFLAEFSKVNLDKLHWNPPQPVILSDHRRFLQYKKAMDGQVLKVGNDLESASPEWKPQHPIEFGSNVTTSEDPKFADLKDSGNVFVTDKILSALMTVTRGVHPWHIHVTKQNGKLYFDTDDQSGIYLPTVYENAGENMPEEDEVEGNINNVRNLSKEADRITRAMYKKVLVKPITNNQNPHPFDNKFYSFIGYRYNSYKVNDNLTIVVRGDAHARTEVEELDQKEGVKVTTERLIKLACLHEYDAKVSGGFAAKLGAFTGQVVGAELKNNSCRLSRLEIEAILGGCNLIKLGFVVRKHVSMNNAHKLLFINSFRVNDFAADLNLDVSNCWGVFRTIMEALMNRPDGRYLLVKEAARSSLKMYFLPDIAEEEEKEQF